MLPHSGKGEQSKAQTCMLHASAFLPNCPGISFSQSFFRFPQTPAWSILLFDPADIPYPDLFNRPERKFIVEASAMISSIAIGT